MRQRPYAIAIGLCSIAVFGLVCPAVAEDFYAGKTINLIVSGGGTYETYGRTFARHLPRFIPGKPTIIVQQLPGGGGIRAANFLYKIAPRDVQPGRSFAGEITRAIQRSRVMVLIFSAYSNTSEQVLREVQLAANSHLHIVQFRIADVLPNDDLEYYLSTPHWLDALTPPLEGHLGRLGTSIKALLEMTPEDSTKSAVPSALPAAEERSTTTVNSSRLRGRVISSW